MELFKNIDCKNFFADANELYNSLGDDISKEIFLSRMNMSIAGFANAYKNTNRNLQFQSTINQKTLLRYHH